MAGITILDCVCLSVDVKKQKAQTYFVRGEFGSTQSVVEQLAMEAALEGVDEQAARDYGFMDDANEETDINQVLMDDAAFETEGMESSEKEGTDEVDSVLAELEESIKADEAAEVIRERQTESSKKLRESLRDLQLSETSDSEQSVAQEAEVERQDAGAEWWSDKTRALSEELAEKRAEAKRISAQLEEVWAQRTDEGFDYNSEYELRQAQDANRQEVARLEKEFDESVESDGRKANIKRQPTAPVVYINDTTNALWGDKKKTEPFFNGYMDMTPEKDGLIRAMVSMMADRMSVDASMTVHPDTYYIFTAGNYDPARPDAWKSEVNGWSYSRSKREAHPTLAAFIDKYGYSWSKFQEMLDTFSNCLSEGKKLPNTLAMRRIELLVDRALTRGYQDISGRKINPSPDYIRWKFGLEGSPYNITADEFISGLNFDGIPFLQAIQGVELSPGVDTIQEWLDLQEGPYFDRAVQWNKEREADLTYRGAYFGFDYDGDKNKIYDRVILDNQQDGGDVKYSLNELSNDEKYSYDVLTAKPDMNVVDISDTSVTTRGEAINAGQENARKYDTTENSKNPPRVYVEDLGKNVIVGHDALRHGLDGRRVAVQIPVVAHIGDILKNSIVINEANPKKQNVDTAWILLGAASDGGTPVFVRSIVNQSTWQVEDISLYAVYGKKNGASRNVSAPMVLDESSIPATSSTISVADMLDAVKDKFSGVLSNDVIEKLGIERQNEPITSSLRYSLNTGVLAEQNQRDMETAINYIVDQLVNNGPRAVEIAQKLTKLKGGMDIIAQARRAAQTQWRICLILTKLSKM